MDARSQDRARCDATPRSGPRPGEPEPRRAGQHVLWRDQEFGPRQGSLARIDAGAFHAEEDHHPQSRLGRADHRQREAEMGRVILRLVLLVPLIAVAAGFLWLRSSLPITEGRLTLPGLTAALSITRDAHGIPTIKAENEQDAAFALGFLRSEERR